MRNSSLSREIKPERIRVRQAAAILGIAARTVQLMALRGELPRAARVGRVWTFEEAALREYIEERIQRPSRTTQCAGSARPADLRMPLSDTRALEALNEARARLKDLVRRGR